MHKSRRIWPQTLLLCVVNF